MPDVIRFCLAAIVVLAGLAWAVIWFLGVIQELKGADWTVLKKVPIPVAASWLLTGSYALFYYVYSMIVGGNAMPRLSANSTYSLIWDGKSKDVSRELYLRSEAGEAILVALLLLCMATTAVLLKNKGPGEA